MEQQKSAGFKAPAMHACEPQRQRSLDNLLLLDSAPQAQFDRITELTASIFKVPIATISLIDRDRQWFLSKTGIDASETPREVSFCGHALHEEEIFVVENACEHPDFNRNPLVCEAPHIGFYAGALIRDESGLPLGTLCIISDRPRSFSEKNRHLLIQLAGLARSEMLPDSQAMSNRAKLQLKAQIDPLTKAQWRERFTKIFDQKLNDGFRSESAFLAVVNIRNLDSFNMMLGRQVGDQVLQIIAERLGQFCEAVPDIFLGRLSGRLLSLLVDSESIPRDKETVAARLCSLLRTPLETTSGSITPIIHTGISWCTKGAPAEQTIDQCQVAISDLNSLDGIDVSFFDRKRHTAYIRSCTIAGELRPAIDTSGFHLVYQPKIASIDYELQGFECLLRWNHHELGLISPLEILGVAKQINLLPCLDKWVITKALQQMSQWDNKEYPYGTVAVNITDKTLLASEFPQWLEEILSGMGVNPEQLILEILEHSLFDNFDQVTEVMRRVSQLGVTFSLDDFGTGYSSLSYLKSLPVNTLKIDRSFVKHIVEDQWSSSMVSGIIRLAKDLRLSVVAEGVETADQLMILRAFQCDLIQGYFMSKPEQQEEIERWFESNSCPWKMAR